MEIENTDEGSYTSEPKAKLDAFNTWDEVHSDDSWNKICRGNNWSSAEEFENEYERATARLDEAMLQEFRHKIIPPKDLFADLKTLQPSTKSQMPVEFQTRILGAMRKQDLHDDSRHAIHGWAFFGPAGWSKSTLCTAWFTEFVRQHILDLGRLRYANMTYMEIPKGREGHPFWRMNALTLIDENLAWTHRNFSDKDAKQPRVSSAWIENLNSHVFDPCLYLEEVDKVRADKTKLDILFDVINALYSCNGKVENATYHNGFHNGVLLLNSNLTKQEFAAQFGPEFARRIAEMCNIVDCFAQEIRLL